MGSSYFMFIALGVAALLILFTVLMPAKKCPKCGTALPKFRTPTSGRQAMWGGWTCPKCGAEITSRGRMRK